MKKSLMILAIALAVVMIAPATAQAYVWRNVGGDPLHANVNSAGKFSYLMLNSSKIKSAMGKVQRANKQPAWILAAAREKVSDGEFRSGTIKRGTRVGAMSYGRRYVRVVKGTIYRGQYKRLPVWYVDVQEPGSTVVYRVLMAKRCGNIFIMKIRGSVPPPPPPPPPPAHSISVIAAVRPLVHLDSRQFMANMTYQVMTNTDNDTIVSATWYINGVPEAATALTTPTMLNYDTPYTFRIVIVDARGHSAEYTTSLNVPGPGSPPPPL